MFDTSGSSGETHPFKINILAYNVKPEVILNWCRNTYRKGAWLFKAAPPNSFTIQFKTESDREIFTYYWNRSRKHR